MRTLVGLPALELGRRGRRPRGSRGRRRRPGRRVAVAPSSAPMFAMTWRSIASSCCEALAVVLDDAAHAAADAVAAQHLQHHVLRGDPVRQRAGQLHAPDLRHRDVQRLAGHRHRDLEPAHADRQHAQRAGGAGVGVRADQQCAGTAEVGLVDRMGDAVAGLGEPQPEALGRGLQEQVVVGVLLVGLQQVVVDVLHRQLGADPVQAHRLQLEHHHGAGGVLGEGLVDRAARSRLRARASPRRDARR